MLRLDEVDLDELSTALEDNSWQHSWWLDLDTGQIEYRSPDDDDIEDFEDRGLIPVEPIGSAEAYTDMSDFVEGLRAGRPREVLGRAIQGRGAFRRFKDTLFEFPELREEWFRFHARRMRRRAIAWLAEQGLVDSLTADAALADLRDDVGPVEPEDVASRAAAALQELYGERLAAVVLFGSHARGDADRESDIDLLVVLSGSVSPWEELRRLDELLWQLTFDHGITVSALPVSDEQWRRGRAPALVEARANGAILT